MMIKEKYDEDEVYDGVQLIYNHNNEKIAFKFPSPFKETEIPFVYDNKLMMLNIEHPFPIITSEEPIEDMTLVSAKLGDMLIPLGIDPSIILKKPLEFTADVYDLVWFIITGNAKYAEDTITDTETAKRFIKEQIDFEPVEEPKYSNVLDEFVSQYWATDDKMVTYHPEMRPATLIKSNDNYDLYIGSNNKDDNYTDHCEIDIKNKILKHSKKPVDIDMNLLIHSTSINDLSNFIKALK